MGSGERKAVILCVLLADRGELCSGESVQKRTEPEFDYGTRGRRVRVRNELGPLCESARESREGVFFKRFSAEENEGYEVPLMWRKGHARQGTSCLARVQQKAPCTSLQEAVREVLTVLHRR